MERLTYRLASGATNLMGIAEAKTPFEKAVLRQDGWERLANYEDIGTVEDFQRLVAKMVSCPKGWRGTRDTRYICPCCKKAVRNDESYCHKCGQALLFPKQVYDKENNKIWLDFSKETKEALNNGV